MKCLRSGYCCLSYDVIIVDDPDLVDELGEVTEDNIVHKKCGERCKHLVGTEAGQFQCGIHDRSWYDETPCFAYGQIERSPDDPCRMGTFVLSGGLDAKPV